MQVSEALRALQQDESIAVTGKTFEPTSIEVLQLDTGEKMFWIRDGGDLWMSLDPESEEVILFNDVEIAIDAAEDTIMYNGEDYEFSYAGEAKLFEEEEEVDTVLFRDFGGPGGEILRVREYAVNGDVVSAIGEKVPEEHLQSV